MHFGIFSHGFRAQLSASESYEEDIREIVLADELGFRDAYISEHHGEPSHIGRVATVPVPEMLICKAAALTKKIRMGAAVKVIHLQHPIDIAIQAAVTDHLLGPGRYIFGFGTGFAAPLFSEERGLSFEDRHARLLESLEAILKCWRETSPFDLNGKFWHGKGLVALPKPRDPAGPAMATATDSEPMLRIAAARGYTLLAAHIDRADRIRARTEQYVRYAVEAGHPPSVANIAAARLVYIAPSREEAIEDMRAAVALEVGVQAERGFLSFMKKQFGIDVPNDRRAIEAFVEAGIYMVGTADQVTRQLERFYDECGGFGTLLIVTGKSWSTREKRERSMRTFMREVAPHLRALEKVGAQ